LSTAKDFYDATTAELERASKASLSLEVGSWIKEQRSLISNRLLKAWDQNQRDLLQSDTESDYLERDLQGQNQEFFEQLQQANDKLSGEVDYTVEDLEARLYEQWINAHFTSFAQDALGCIEYQLNFQDEKFDFQHCRVMSPFGDKLDEALNLLLDRGRLTGISNPIDFKVRKRVCMGSGPWDCSGWLDEDNNVIDEPSSEDDRNGFHGDYWRSTISHFFH